MIVYALLNGIFTYLSYQNYRATGQKLYLALTLILGFLTLQNVVGMV